MAIIYDSSNDAMVQDNEYFKLFVEEKGGKVLFSEGFKGDEIDFRTTLLKFREHEEDVEAVFIAVVGILVVLNPGFGELFV